MPAVDPVSVGDNRLMHDDAFANPTSVSFSQWSDWEQPQDSVSRYTHMTRLRMGRER